MGFNWSAHRPELLAGEVVGEESDVAERHVQAPSVRGRCLGCVGVLQVTRRRRNAAMRLVLPHDLSGVPVNGIDHPPVFDGRRRPFTAEIQAAFGGFDLPRRNHRGDEDAIAPCDRRRPAVPGNRRLPTHVLRGAPRLREARSFSDAGGTRPAELRPPFDSISDGLLAIAYLAQGRWFGAHHEPRWRRSRPRRGYFGEIFTFGLGQEEAAD